MQEASASLQLAGWVGRKGRGAARLSWDGEELILRLNALHIVGAEGPDGDLLSSAFGLSGEGDWFRQARSAVEAGQVTESEAIAVVKRALTERLRAFFLAADGRVEFEPGIPSEETGFTVSYPHMVIELILGIEGEELVDVFLADPTLTLRRLPDFARRVGALQLTDEALAILAKINDLRTAKEIADPSPHGRDTVVRLLAATVGAGLVEAVPGLADTPLAPLVSEEVGVVHGVERPRRRWLIWAIVIAVVVVAAAMLWSRPWQATEVGSGGPWAVAVDGGCQPAELERLYRRQDADPENLAVVPFGPTDERCYRLVWGHFPDQAAAEAAMGRLSQGLVTRGFAPHVVRVDADQP